MRSEHHSPASDFRWSTGLHLDLSGFRLEPALREANAIAAHRVSALCEERRACGAVGTICRHSDLLARRGGRAQPP
jgi:hypothetical protein